MIAVEDNIGIIFVRAVFHGFDNFADLLVNKTYAGEVGLNQWFPLIIFDNPLLSRRDMFKCSFSLKALY